MPNCVSSKLDASNGQGTLPIAIVGIAAEIPSGVHSQNNLDHNSFFDFLLNKCQAYQKIPSDRFNIDAWKGNGPGLVSTEVGAFLKDITLFDHLEFGVTSKDAQAMAVSTRKLIHLSFLALLDSGIDYRGQNVGCFTSGIVHDILAMSEADIFEARGSFGGIPSMIANRVSYHLDLLGPSIPVDTACSSSLMATHLAVQALRNGDCEAAVCGGIQTNHRFIDWVQYSQAGVLAPDGVGKPFDASADGFSRGEAGVVIVLKTLDRAIEDKDRIYATILGTGINSAGLAAPVNAPVAEAQRDAMRRAWAQAGRNPTECDYVEVHATGTAAGDPTEVNWVGDAFQRPDGEVLLGSVKGNIGHTEIAAFLASLVKVVNMMKTRTVPPQVNLHTLNPAIKWAQYHLHVPTEIIPLPIRSTTGRALISLASSGIGGANGHAVVEGPPTRADHLQPSGRPFSATILVAGGLSPRTATAVSESASEFMLAHSSESDLSLISTLYGRRSRQMTWRSFAIVEGDKVPHFSQPVLVPRAKSSLVFVFSGQGPQHLEMGRQLFRQCPPFRKSILSMDSLFKEITGYSLVHDVGLFGTPLDKSSYDLSGVWPIAITLPALTILQCALFDLLSMFNVCPDIVVGHSAGEVPLMYASGAASRSMVVELAIARGKAMSIAETVGGTMAALACGPVDAQAIITETLKDGKLEVEIACHNSPDAVTISGFASSVHKVVAAAKDRGILATALRTKVPVHSSLMDNCHEEYQRATEEVWIKYTGFHKPTIETYSTVTGKVYNDVFTPKYSWDGTRNPVLFSEAVSSLMHNHPSATFIEISAHPVLSSYLSSFGAGTVLSPLRRPKRNEVDFSEHLAFLDTLGRLIVSGHNGVDFARLNGDPDLNCDLQLPCYPFALKHVPFHSESPSFQKLLQDRIGPLNHPRLRINSKTHPVIAEHVIKGEPIMPAAGYLESALEFGARTLWDVEFRSILSMSSAQPMTVQVDRDHSHWSVKTSSVLSGYGKDQSWIMKNTPPFDRLHAEGYLSFDDAIMENDCLNLNEIMARCEPMSLNGFYESLETFANYGPTYQRVKTAYQGKDEVLVEVTGNDGLLDLEGYIFHPAILDACLHVTVHESFTLNADPSIYYLPSKVGRFTIHNNLVSRLFPEVLYAHAVLAAWRPEAILANLAITDSAGNILCRIDEIEFARHYSVPIFPPVHRYDMKFQPVDIPCASCPEEDAVVETSDMHDLYAALDAVTFKAIRHAIEEQWVPGDDLDRQRYFLFLRSAVEPGAIPKDLAEASRETWPTGFEVVDRVSTALKNIMISSKAAVEALYTDSIMTTLYQHFDYATKVHVKRFCEIVRRIVETTGKNVIRVLEVGAGTGALTRAITAALSDMPEVIIEYTVTDVSKQLLPRVAYPRARYRTYDVSLDPETQGIVPGFDIILAFQVLHAVSHIAPLLPRLNQLLVPGGFILVEEINGAAWVNHSPGAMWHDFIFGSFASWFGYADGRRHCAMDVETWREYLHAAGFDNVSTLKYSGDALHFLLEAQKQKSSPTSLMNDNVIMFHYKRGAERDLRGEVVSLGTSEKVSLWVLASFGIDGDAAMGLTKSLARELEFWNIHLVIFQGDQDVLQREETTRALSRTPGVEPVVLIGEDGSVNVPRVVPMENPTGHRPFQPKLPWRMSGSLLSHFGLMPLERDQLSVRIESMSSGECDIRGFVGHVIDAGTTPFHEGDIVVGIAAGIADICNVIAVHFGIVSLLPAMFDLHEAAANSVGFAIAALALGSTTLIRRKSYLRSKRVLVCHADRENAKVLIWYLRQLGLEPDTLVQSISPQELASCRRHQGPYELTVVACSSIEEYEIFSHAGFGVIFSWYGPTNDLAQLFRTNPWAIGEALEAAFNDVTLPLPCSGLYIYPTDIVKCEERLSVPYLGPLFDPEKAYILVGGVGGLGVRIALWMYEQGARYIVLTSRSGRQSLNRSQDTQSIYILKHLESLHDLTVRVEASDATSCVACATLLATVQRPIGGCMILTMFLADRSFAFQTDSDFEKVWASKVTACQVLVDCLNVSSLDFFVAFSSCVSLVGNIGQTNYSSANSALDGLMRAYNNAFSFICPAVLDGGGLALATRERIGHLSPWGMTSREICSCLGDAILKLADGPFWQYIPALRWDVVQANVGASCLFSHLVDDDGADGIGEREIEAGGTMLDIITTLLEVPITEFSPNVPFTAYGLDSISAAKLSFFLRPFLAVSQLQLLSDLTLQDIQNLINNQGNNADAALASGVAELPVEPNIAQDMNALMKKYSSNFPIHKSFVEERLPSEEVILLTGSTGALGTSVLAQLVELSSVGRIYALNRRDTRNGTSLEVRQASALRQRGYDEAILRHDKVVLVEGDITLPQLGISYELFDEMRSSVTTIIHNAWPVNFTMPLASFESSIQGLRHLIDLALVSPKHAPPRFIFLSSIGVLSNTTSSGPALEELVPASFATGTGYSKSKWVGERILENAAALTPLKPVIIRPGQIAGAVNGSWNTAEWFPCIVRASPHLECLPDGVGEISWIPLHDAGKVIVEMRNSPDFILHLVHPNPVSWSDICGPIAQELSVPIVPYSQWLSRLEDSLSNHDSSHRTENPAVPLIEFFRGAAIGDSKKEAFGLPRLSIEQALQVSPSLKNLQKLDPLNAIQWLKWWKQYGYL